MTTMHERPSLQSMVKAAMAGTTQQLSVNLEASRQASTRGGATKTASAPVDLDKHVPTELAHKLASALGYIEQQLRKEAELMPGEGPGALTVLEAGASGGPILSGGDSGQATAQNQPPRTPALQAEEVQSGNAGTGLETNDDMSHPEQPIEPIKNASGLAASNMQRLRKMAGIADVAKGAVGKVKGVANKINKSPTLMRASEFVKEHKTPLAAGAGALVGAGAGAALGSRKKEGSAPIALLRKLAEDAINPAHIESAKGQGDSPEGASASGEGVPSEPSDVSSQKNMISSNEAAINYTKGQAKADPKRDVNQVLQEPALSSASDKVLQEAFANTGAAGVKISSAGGLKKTAMAVGAQRVMLDRLLKQANSDCATAAVGKDKKSMGMAPSTPQAATGASAATMGQ